MEALQIIELLLMLMGASVLACWIAYSSTVIQEIKGWFGLDDRDRKPVKWRWFAKPFVWLWTELRSLLNCPYCLSFWLGLLVCFFQGLVLWQSVFYAALCIVFVEVYRKLTL